MTSNHNQAPVETLLREAMIDRANSLSPSRPPLQEPRRNITRLRFRQHGTLGAVLLTAVAVVAVAVGASTLIGGGPGRSLAPAAPGQTDPGITSTTTGEGSQPGGDVVTAHSKPVTVTESGTQTVHLGVPPAGTTAIEIQFTCLTAGRYEFADGAAVDCDPSSISTPTAHSIYRLPTDTDTRGTTITALAGKKWTATFTYVSIATSSWKVNEYGQTYGVQNESGTPDLVAAIATNGEQGYVLSADLNAATHPTNPAEAATVQPGIRTIPVYKSDGTTKIGEFKIQ